MPKISHIVVALVFIAVGIYVGTKYPSLLGKVTAGTVSA